MAIKQVKSVAAVSGISVPCGTPFANLAGYAKTPVSQPLPTTLQVTFDDSSTQTLPITWEMGAYDPWDNIGKSVTLKGTIVLPQVGGTNNVDTYLNDNRITASCTVTTTVVTTPGITPNPNNAFCDGPGQPIGPGVYQN